MTRTSALVLATLIAWAASPLPAQTTQRQPWSSSRFRGSPDPPPPYRVEVAFPRLQLTHPVVITSAPGTDRLFIVEQEGRVSSFPNDPACERVDIALDLATRIDGCNIYGLTFHPRFEENRYAFLCYVLPGTTPEGTRVSRFEVTRTEPPRIDPASEKILITWLSGGHNGGCLAFGPDGDLYISTGDATDPSPPDRLDTGQDLSDLLSSILRIDVDHEEAGRPYAVPADNPFVREPRARPEIWAYGLRNPWKMSFDGATGDLWVGDVGWEMWELVYRVERGGNYGWSVMEGRQPVQPRGRRGPTPILPPLKEHPHSEGASVTGGCVYHGARLEDLRGAYVYGDYVTGKVWALRQTAGKVTSHREIADTALHIVAFGEDRAGEIYILDHEPTGKIYRLVPNSADAAQRSFPRRLSETGLFESVRDGEPAPGVLSFSVAAEAWSDGAEAERLLALPRDARIDTSDPSSWKFPDGTVLARTLSVSPPKSSQGDAPRRRIRVETQVLHLERGTWRPYAYAWNEEGTDAALVDAQGASSKVRVQDPSAPAGTRERTWRIASRSECAICHNPWAGNVLGACSLQLDREVDLGGAKESQIRALERLGVFSQPIGERDGGAQRIVDPHDPGASFEARARSYLHVNCSHCHRFGAGGTALIDLTLATGLEKTRAVGAAPLQGAFEIPGARIIAPGDPYRSVLYCRMAKLGGGHMPRVGPHEADEQGLELIHDWIASLPASGETAPADDGVTDIAILEASGERSREDCRESIRKLTATTSGALRLASRIGRGALAHHRCDEAIAAARLSSSADVRDLFERFLPEEERISRLGAAFRPEEVLTLMGDPVHGKEVFFQSAAAQCKSCHAAEGAGTSVGPDLSHIGKKFTAEQILEHTVSPSKEIAPEYAAYVVVIDSGQVLTGLLAEKSESEIALKDAQGNVTRVPASKVQRLERQEKSLMPELLLQDLTAQAAADLIAYLAALK